MKKKSGGGKGHTSKHAGSRKHHARTSKHHPKQQAHPVGHGIMGGGGGPGPAHTKARHAHHAKGLALAPGDVACCTAEALAALLRLSGWPVSDDDVLALHRLTGADDEQGAPILATLEAASAFGLAGCHPASFSLAPWRAFPAHVSDAAHRAEPLGADSAAALDVLSHDASEDRKHLAGVALLEQVHAVILGVDLPGPHAVLATPDGWWSWGELWCPCEFPDAVIDEAWEVSWRLVAPVTATGRTCSGQLTLRTVCSATRRLTGPYSRRRT